MAETRKKKKIDLVSTDNDLIQQLPDTDYIKNPLVYSQIRGDFSLIQTNVLVAIASTMQDRINSKFNDKGQLGPLFSKEELGRGKITFEVPLQALGVKTKEYASVHEACRGLTKLDTTFTYTDQNSGEKRTRTSVIFTDVDIPTYITTTGSERRTGMIKIDMNASVAEQIFNTSGAYVEHMKDIVKLCRSPRTPRLYIYLSAWKRQKVCTFGYEALKEFLGVLVYNKDRTKIVQDKSSTWAVFHRDVLDPAKREMKRLAEEGRVDFFFEYEPVYHTGKKRGNPNSVRFFLHATDPIQYVEEKVPETPKVDVPMEHWQQWVDFCKKVKELDPEYYRVFVTPCGLKSVEEKRVIVTAPSKFVVEQWEKKISEWYPLYLEVFGQKSLNYNVDLNYIAPRLFDEQ